jgi:hypothetical protein
MRRYCWPRGGIEDAALLVAEGRDKDAALPLRGDLLALPHNARRRTHNELQDVDQEQHRDHDDGGDENRCHYRGPASSRGRVLGTAPRDTPLCGRIEARCALLTKRCVVRIFGSTRLANDHRFGFTDALQYRNKSRTHR